MKVSDAKRLRELEAENRQLKQLLEEAYGKDGSLGALDNSSSLPLSHRPEDDKLSLRDWT